MSKRKPARPSPAAPPAPLAPASKERLYAFARAALDARGGPLEDDGLSKLVMEAADYAATRNARHWSDE